MGIVLLPAWPDIRRDICFGMNAVVTMSGWMLFYAGERIGAHAEGEVKAAAFGLQAFAFGDLVLTRKCCYKLRVC